MADIFFCLLQSEMYMADIFFFCLLQSEMSGQPFYFLNQRRSKYTHTKNYMGVKRGLHKL
jgi:hypothetical protein